MKYYDQLKIIMKASGWSQEQLASQLEVSFPTLNSWINQKSIPRAKALDRIEELYEKTVGVTSVDESVLATKKEAAGTLRLSSKDLAVNNALLDKLTLYLTYHTNTIEGSTMTLSDVQDVLFDSKVLSNRTAIEQAEARNHRSALHWLIDQLNVKGAGFTIDAALIMDIHLRLMNGIVSDAGQYRKHTVRIMGSQAVLANWVKVPELIAELTNKDPQEPQDPIAEMAYFHAEFEKIHPFSDGNGRTGRLIMLAQALHLGMMPPLVAKERKFSYYKSLEAAQTKDSYGSLEFFLAESVEFAHSVLATEINSSLNNSVTQSSS